MTVAVEVGTEEVPLTLASGTGLPTTQQRLAEAQETEVS